MLRNLVSMQKKKILNICFINLTIEDNFFDDNDSEEIKEISEDVIENKNLNDVPFVDLATDAPKRVKIISDPNRIHLASNKIKKCIRQR